MTVVTIDGPAGAGKSTIAAALAERLGIPHVDTGAFYRAATLAVLRAGADPLDPDASLAAVTAVTITREDGRTLLDGEDVEREIRSRAVTKAVSAVARHPAVRLALLQAQRDGIREAGAVVEGRDAGTVVAPLADLKVWLTASTTTRAARRAQQLGETGRAAVDTHADDLARRDRLDAEQMARAADAVVVDTTGRPVGEVVDEIAALVAR